MAGEQPTRLARAQFIVHQMGALIMLCGLFLPYGNFVAPAQVEMVPAPSTIIVFSAAVMMMLLVP